MRYLALVLLVACGDNVVPLSPDASPDAQTTQRWECITQEDCRGLGIYITTNVTVCTPRGVFPSTWANAWTAACQAREDVSCPYADLPDDCGVYKCVETSGPCP